MPSVRPLTPPKGSDITFGAVVDDVDLENLTGKYSTLSRGDMRSIGE